MCLTRRWSTLQERDLPDYVPCDAHQSFKQTKYLSSGSFNSMWSCPPDLLRMFFDCLYDEDVISEDAFYKWESSKDPAEQHGKGVALKSVTAFFTWLREAEEESEDN